jgi:glycosyltransferase involved in cell wall biosynthesis
VDRVVVTSVEVERAWRAAMPALDHGRIALVPKGIEAPAPTTTPGAARDAFRRELGLKAQDVVVLGLARLVVQKRLDRFIDVFAHLPPEAHGVVAGDGPLRGELEMRARQRGAPVHFLGHVQEVGDLLAAADVLLLTSDREAMANAMLEAMAAGLPVVSTPVAGADEALAGAEGDVPPGRVSAGFEVADIASALEPLLLDHELRRAMGRAAALRARRRFGPDRMLDGWEHLLREVVGSTAGAVV